MSTAAAPRLPDDDACMPVPLTRDELAALLWGLDRLADGDRDRHAGLRRRLASALAELTPTGARGQPARPG